MLIQLREELKQIYASILAIEYLAAAERRETGCPPKWLARVMSAAATREIS